MVKTSAIVALSVAAGSLGAGAVAAAFPGARKAALGTISRACGARAHPRVPGPPAVGAPQTGLSVDPSRYPTIRRDEGVVDHLHGVAVADPYRWLEDPDSEETTKFVQAQNALTDEVLAQCETRAQFKELFTKLYDYPKFGTPFKRGPRYYWYYNSGLQQQYVIYSQASLTADKVLLLDPNTWSADGTVALKDIDFSDDGTLLSYSTSSGGSDWAKIEVLRIDPATGQTTKLPDQLQYVKFSSMSFTHDNRGFFYNRYAAPKASDLGTETDINTHQQLCYHVVGTEQSDDVLLMVHNDHPLWMTGASVSDDGRYLILYVSEGCQPANRIFIVDMEALTERLPNGSVDWKAYDVKKGRKSLPLIKLVDDFSASFSYVANDGPRFVLTTNLNAPRYKVVVVPDVAKAGPASTWQDLIPQHDKDVLKGAVALKGDNLVVRYLRDVRGALQLRSLATGALVRELPLPGVGTVTGFSGDRKSFEGFFSFTSFVEPGATYRMDLSEPNAEPQLYRRTELSVPHNPQDYVTKQVFVPSRDGVRVPMFITHHKSVALDGSAPTLLYAYGGFNVSLEPGFSASRLAFMRGYRGVFAQANLRGGGEYGVEWRNAGSKENKQNVFNDFQACAEFLQAAGYCSPSTLTIQGGSNGGLLVSACTNQRPDLYACVIGQVGVCDMLRFHKFTIGHAWTTDYGCADNAEEFEYLLPYSPVHNVRVPKGGSQQYPAVLLTTGDHDDRVVPLHSYKLLAALQHTLLSPAPKPDAASSSSSAAVTAASESAQRNPLLIRIEVRAGHGAGKPTQKVIEEAADIWGFAAKCMRAKWVDGTTPPAPAATAAPATVPA